MLLPMIVYPKLIAYMEKKDEDDKMHCGIMEQYFISEGKIKFVIGLSKPQQFKLTKFESPTNKKTN